MEHADMARRGDPGQNPTLRGRRLAMELLRRREATGMSREEVARQLEWSTSTIFRIETGRSRPQPGNVRILLELYGVTGAERDGLIQLTREARQPGWWHSFRDVLPNPYEVYIGLEAGAASLRNFEPVVVPGLLQTAVHAYLQRMPGVPLSIVMVTVEPGATLVPALGVWPITCPGAVHCALCSMRTASPTAVSSRVAWAAVSPYLNIQRLNYLWTIRHSSARIAGNLVT